MTARVAVVVASAGRAGAVADLLNDLTKQSVAPDAIYIAVPDEESVPPSACSTVGISVLLTPRGLTYQRNCGVAAAATAHDYIAFFDDDARLHPNYLERAIAVLDDHTDAVGVTGRVVVDGTPLRREIPNDIAERALAQPLPTALSDPVEVPTLYGCNFVVRASAARHVRFDENLPLYGWLEDRDFSVRLRRRGRLYSVPDALIVHRAQQGASRLSNLRTGYSQIANPLYLWRRSLGLRDVIGLILPRVGANLLRSWRGSERDWRRQRLRGNALAARDLLRRKLTPGRILEF